MTQGATLDHGRLLTILRSQGLDSVGVGGTDWATLVTEPPLTSTQRTALEAAYTNALTTEEAQRTQRAADNATTRTLVFQTAQTAVGVNLAALNAAQVRALLSVLMYKNGALNPDGTVRPLTAWA